VFPATPNATSANVQYSTGVVVKLDSTGAKILVTVRGFGPGPVAYDASSNLYFAGSEFGSLNALI
jgi:hypothetical protein